MSLLIISCEKGFEPKADFKKQYVLFSLIDGDSSYQTVIVSSSYDVDKSNLNPYSNLEDPDIGNAKIILTRRNNIHQLLNTYTLTDTVAPRTGNLKYSTPQSFYYTSDLNPDEGDFIDIEVTIDGKVLKAQTQLPLYSSFFWDQSDNQYPVSKNYSQVLFQWKLSGTNHQYVFAPRFLIHYTENINGEEIPKIKEVPHEYKKQGSEYFPAFIRALTKNAITYDTAFVNRAFNEIAPPNSDRSLITIEKVEFELTIFDDNFGSYYNAIQTVNDGFTVRIYETNFSNVNSGIGVFGSYFIKRKELYISKIFIQSLGYKSK